MPEATTAWETVPIVLATVVIALFTVALFVLQYLQHKHDKKVSSATYAMNLFERRLQTYFEIEKCLQQFIREGRPTPEAAANLYRGTRTANFLFPEETQVFIKEIVDNSFEHRIHYSNWDALRNSAWEGKKLSDSDLAMKNNALLEMHKIENWFQEQVENKRLEKEVAPRLKLAEVI